MNDCKYRALILIALIGIIIVALLSYLYAVIITGNKPHKGHDFYAGLDETSRFNPDWYLGMYLYLMDPLYLKIFVIIGHILGITPIQTQKFFYMFFYFLSFVTFYICAYAILRDHFAAFIGALGYLLNPYHLVESIIEGHGLLNIAISLIPLPIMLVELCVRDKVDVIKITLLSLTLAGIMYTHPQMVVLFFYWFVLYVTVRLLLQFKRNIKEFIKTYVKILIVPLTLCLLLSLSYIAPLLAYKNLFYTTGYSLSSTYIFSAMPISIICMSPQSCCVPQVMYFYNDPLTLFSLLIYPISVALCLLFINRFSSQDKYLVATLVTIHIILLPLAFGPIFPLPLFKVLFKYFPLFDIVRTPCRYLLMDSLVVCLLLSIFVKYIPSIFRSKDTCKYIFYTFIVILIILGSRYTVFNAFQTFTLPHSLISLYSFLSHQKYGRIFTVPIDAWIYTKSWRNVVNPLLWTWEFHKETVSGGAPPFATRQVGDYLNFIYWASHSGTVKLSHFIYLYNVRYIVIDKKYISVEHFSFGNKIQKIYENKMYIVYLNNNTSGYVFLLTSKSISLKFIKPKWAQGTTSLKLLQKNESSFTIKYVFKKPGFDFLCFSIPMKGVNESLLTYYDEIAFHYTIRGVNIGYINWGVAAVEKGGARYYVEWQTFPSDSGYISVPFGLLQLRYTVDKDHKLDLNQLKEIWICIGERSYYSLKKVFTVTFSNISIIENSIFKSKYIRISKSEFKVPLLCVLKIIRENIKGKHIYIVLNYAYFPDWKAYLICNDSKVITLSHKRVLYFLNGFSINVNVVRKCNPSTSAIIIKYVPSTIEILSSSISLVLFLALTVLLIAYCIYRVTLRRTNVLFKR